MMKKMFVESLLKILNFDQLGCFARGSNLVLRDLLPRILRARREINFKTVFDTLI